MSYLHDIHRKQNIKQSFEVSALAENQEYVEKLPHEKNILENELSSKPEDGYAILLKKLNAFYSFCRPYNLVGIEVGILSASLLPIGSISDLSPAFFMGLLQSLVLGALIHIYVMAVNQLSDVEIDKVNKQYLPLASGEFSSRDIVAVSLLATMLSIGIVFMSESPALLCSLIVNYLFATAYSAELPFLRWKRHPLLTIPCVVIWGALGIQIFNFIHIQKYVLGRHNLATNSLVFQTTMIGLYCISGMIFKDIPDTERDRENDIETLSIRFGEERAFAIVLNVMYAAYGLVMVLRASSSLWSGKLIVILGHLAFALVVWRSSRYTDPTNKSSA